MGIQTIRLLGPGSIQRCHLTSIENHIVKTIVWSSYLHKGISYAGKSISLHWIKAQVCSHGVARSLGPPAQFPSCFRVVNMHLGQLWKQRAEIPTGSVILWFLISSMYQAHQSGEWNDFICELLRSYRDTTMSITMLVLNKSLLVIYQKLLQRSKLACVSFDNIVCVRLVHR